MATFIPITLRGDNLGDRHRHFNTLVQDALQQNSSPEHILELPEISPIDKLFKIDVALKQRNVDFIVKTLKHDDMLYVSKALKCVWLIDPEYQGIINPNYLESELYPHMITPAVNKMKNWVQINLRDPQRCQEFYKYYNKDYNMKIKYLRHCSREFIMAEFLHIIEKVTPKQLMVLCECCPQVAKMYYDNLSENSVVLKRYLEKDSRYHECTKYLLKVEPDTYFQLLENHYDYKNLGNLSAAATEYIVKKHKDRFVNKPELYAAYLLHKETLAQHLSSEEIKQLVIKLVRAEFISCFLLNTNTKPFIKRLKYEERVAFKKRVFVDKEIGDKVKYCTYSMPYQPEVENLESIFDDPVFYPSDYVLIEEPKIRNINRRKIMHNVAPLPKKSMFKTIFARYRYFNFKATLFELRKRLLTETIPDNRQFMMAILVMKCGQNMDYMEKLLNFFVERLRDEPSDVRADVVRTFAERACVWRLPDAAWSLFLDFGRDLGLDGASSVTCKEGMHAHMLRLLLSGEECPRTLREAFLDNFTVFTEYKLNRAEKIIIKKRLPAFLLTAIAEERNTSLHCAELLINALSALNIRVNECPGAADAVVGAVRRCACVPEDFLERIYNNRVDRRALFRENFAFFKTDGSYLNVLRHDATLLRSTRDLETVLEGHVFRYDRFLKKLALYFGEENGLAAIHKEAITRMVAGAPHVSLARPLALLRAELGPVIDEYMKEPKGSPRKQLAAALQSNYHYSKLIDVDATDWRSIGVKAVANRVMICRSVDVERYIQKSLEWQRTLKLALILAERRENPSRIYKIVGSRRPGAAVRSALFYFERKESLDVDLGVWQAVAPALHKIDFSIEQRRHFRKALDSADYIPREIQIDYWSKIYKIFRSISDLMTPPIICRLESRLPEVDPDIIKTVITDFLDSFTKEVVSGSPFRLKLCYSMKVRILAKFLLLSRSESEQKERLDTVWQPFCERLALLVKENTNDTMLYLDEFIEAQKYQKAFFNTNISCLPVFKRIVTDLREFLPMEGFFQVFVLMHVTMLYHNAVVHVLKEHPDKFHTVQSKQNEASVLVGDLFGKYIGNELLKLVSNYFDSVVILYQDNLLMVLRYQFAFHTSRSKFIAAMISALIEAGSIAALRVAAFVLKGEHERQRLSGETIDIIERLNKLDNDKFKLFYYADMVSCGFEELF